jgi:Icc-related predicted phosphoesterase
MFRLFFVTDIHGSDVCFKKLLKAADVYKPNALLLCGDLTGKFVVPIIRQPDGTFRARYSGSDVVLTKEEGVAALQQKIADTGSYSYEIDSTDIDKQTIEYSKKMFTEKIHERLLSWMNLAETRLKDKKVEFFLSPGNDDEFHIDDLLGSSTYVRYCEDKIVTVGGYEMATLAWTNPTPWETARECSDEELGQRVEKLLSGVSNMKSCIFNFHCPPYDSGLDSAPEMSKDLKAGTEMVPVGSKSIRKAIEDRQPLLGLHGHIHESRAALAIGRTLCINPGSEYGEGILRGAVVNLDNEKVKGYLLTSG